jgi:hypothetical protein
MVKFLSLQLGTADGGRAQLEVALHWASLISQNQQAIQNILLIVKVETQKQQDIITPISF